MNRSTTRVAVAVLAAGTLLAGCGGPAETVTGSASPSSQSLAPPAAAVTPTPAAPTTTTPPPIPTPTTPPLSAGQRSALAKAQDYLDYTAFSQSGLASQLEYEGFSPEDAAFAAATVAVDWNEQAVLKAQDYLDYSSFSRSGLVNQLEYEGFTPEQAEYGAAQTYGG